MRDRARPWRAIMLALALACPATVSAQRLPLFDAHIHYSEDAWPVLDASEAVAVLERAGIRRAIVSSTPDDGTLALFAVAPQRVVPFLRPYRRRGDMLSWTRDESVVAYLEQRLARGIYRGIGEVHLSLDDVDTPVVARVVELAIGRGIFVHVHADAATVTALLSRFPQARLLWAHAGMDASPDTVAELLELSDRVWVELSLRFDVAPTGTPEADWRRVLARFPDRFLVGTDTWIPDRWSDVERDANFDRAWLSTLPPDVAEAIAYRNGERLFGAP